MRRGPRPRRLASFHGAVDMARVPEECSSHVIYAVLSPNPRQRFRLTILLLPEGHECTPSCDGGDPPPGEPWRCRRLVLCCSGYMVVREWIATG